MDVIDFRHKNWVKVGDPLDIAPLLGEGEAEYSCCFTCADQRPGRVCGAGNAVDRLAAAQ